MSQSTNKQHIRPIGLNREIKDAAELCNLDIPALAALLDKEEERCRHELMDEEMFILRKMSWLARIFKRSFRSLDDWQAYIAQRIKELGPGWLEEPPLIEGSTRYLHHQLKQFRRDQQKEAENE